MISIPDRAAVAFAAAALAAGLTIAQEPPQTPLGLDVYYYVPDDNPVTVGKVALGRALFFDTELSSDRRVACASCHKPERAFSDDATISIGADGRMGRRHAPALVNRAYGRSFFWDGRVNSLEAQVLMPILEPTEMNLTREVLVDRLNSIDRYVRAFRTVFGQPPSSEGTSQALATFVRVQRFGDSPFDRYQYGSGAGFSKEAERGLAIFRGVGNCSACHVGPNFTDEKFHNTGVSWGAGDHGRFLVTALDVDRGAFKTPPLREIGRTAPYMHDGSIGSLDEVIAFYARGGRANPHLDREIKPLQLSESDRTDLKAFLLSLSAIR